MHCHRDDPKYREISRRKEKWLRSRNRNRINNTEHGVVVQKSEESNL